MSNLVGNSQVSSRRDFVSLRSHLTWCVVPLQAGLLAVFALLIVGTLWVTGLGLHQRDEKRVVGILKDAVTRNSDGALTLRDTPGLRKLRSGNPGLWFVIRDQEGHSLTEGDVPSEFGSLAQVLDRVGHAKLGWDRSQDRERNLTAQMQRVSTSAGDIQIIATTDAKITDIKSILQIGLAFLWFTLPGLVLMTLTTLIVTPLVIRHALAGLDDAAHQARGIDIDKRGARLPVSNIPVEIVPLVTAVNDALGRLDEGYERHRRFLADAAHELRTPIAILTTRLETLPSSLEKRRLTEDAARLAVLTEQLLDLQRLEQNLVRLSGVDLVSVCSQVVADLAPMAIAAGYEISFQSEAEQIEAWGDGASIGRAMINLVQNAIQHGGRTGTILVSVKQPAIIEVIDQGPGVPFTERDLVFEPFRRLNASGRGAGLGLNLVREIIHLHKGAVSVLDAVGGGACFRITLSPVSVPYLAAG